MDLLYTAFISYRHRRQDLKMARYIQRFLESYTIPPMLARNIHPEAMLKIFRDSDELVSSGYLYENIERALHSSKYLIVVCSTATPFSKWVEAEVKIFIEKKQVEKIIPILIEGTPENAFPKPLLDLYQQGAPLRIFDLSAKNFRKAKKLLKAERFKLLALIRECDYRSLRDLNFRRTVRRTMTIFLSILVIIITFTVFSVSLWNQIRREQLQTAELLIKRDMAYEEAQVQNWIIESVLDRTTYDLPQKFANDPKRLLPLKKVFQNNLQLIQRLNTVNQEHKLNGETYTNWRILNLLYVGEICRWEKRFAEARQYMVEYIHEFQKRIDYDQSYSNPPRLKDLHYLAIGYERVGDTYLGEGKVEDALAYYQRSWAEDSVVANTLREGLDYTAEVTLSGETVASLAHYCDGLLCLMYDDVKLGYTIKQRSVDSAEAQEHLQHAQSLLGEMTTLLEEFRTKNPHNDNIQKVFGQKSKAISVFLDFKAQVAKDPSILPVVGKPVD